MMRAIVLLSLVGFAASAAPNPLTAKQVKGHVELSAEQKKSMHFGCVSACQPSPIESKCATACEAKMYRCIDETGPNETPEDTKKCQDAVLKVYEETKGIEKKAENKTAGNATKGEKKKDAKKAKMFLQVGDVDDEDESSTNENTEQASDESTAEEETQDDSEDVETSADDETGDYSAQEDSGEEEAGTQEEESASQDEESVGEEEETHSEEAETSEAEEETSEEENPVEQANEDEEPSDEAAPEEAAAPEEEEEEAEESFLQKDVDDTVEAAPAVEETQQISDEEEAETQKNTDEEEAKMSDESSDESEGVENAFIQTGSSWKPEPCGELAPGVPCTKLYEHPQGSTFVTACPVGEQTNPESCGAFFGDKAAADQCPQITCSKALGVTMKLVCAGGCCPTCWAPDHVVAVDRHTSIDDAAVVDPAPQAPGTCGGVKCFKLACAAGFSEGFVNGACCNSCVQGR